MTTTSNNILGCFVKGPAVLWDNSEETKNAAANKGKLFREYIWGENGIDPLLKKLNHADYGKDLILILLEFHLCPIPYELEYVRKIGNYRRKEKSIGLPIIADDGNFFSKPENERRKYLSNSVFEKLNLLKVTIKRNKLDTNIDNLTADLTVVLKAFK